MGAGRRGPMGALVRPTRTVPKVGCPPGPMHWAAHNPRSYAALAGRSTGDREKRDLSPRIGSCKARSPYTSSVFRRLIRACVDDECTLRHESTLVDAGRAEALTRLARERGQFVADLERLAECELLMTARGAS